MSRRRELLAVVGLLVVGSVLLLAAGRLEAVARGGGLYALAAIGGILATRGLGRRLVGLVTVLVGVLTVAAAGPWTVVVGGVALSAAGVWTAWRGACWPSMSARYDPKAAPRARETEGDSTRASHDLWDALDRGEDPTGESRQD